MRGGRRPVGPSAAPVLAGFADCIMVASSKMMQSMMQEEENFKSDSALSSPMAEDQNATLNPECTECGHHDPEGVVWWFADDPTNHFVVCVECSC